MFGDQSWALRKMKALSASCTLSIGAGQKHNVFPSMTTVSVSTHPGVVACGVGSQSPLVTQSDGQTPLSISLHPSMSPSRASLRPSGLYIRPTHAPAPWLSFCLAYKFPLFPGSLSSCSAFAETDAAWVLKRSQKDALKVRPTDFVDRYLWAQLTCSS